MLEATSPLQYLKGVGPRRAEILAGVGLRTLEDLLYILPFRWEDRRAFAKLADLGPGMPPRTLSVRVLSGRLIRTRRKNFSIFEARLEDDSGECGAVWYNQPFLQGRMVLGKRLILFGSLTADRRGQSRLENPEYEFVDDDEERIHAGRIVPVYRKVGDIGGRALRGLLHRALAELGEDELPEVVPAVIRERHRLPSRLSALRALHFPPADVSVDELVEQRTVAQRALAFEEAFVVQLGLAVRREHWRRQRRVVRYTIDDELRERLSRVLPFRLTEAQRRVLREIAADLTSDHPMNRLLQGDVGSGKTIVALLTMLIAVENGYQAALMAPTEILAEQHQRSLTALLEPSGIDVGLTLLTGSLRAAKRRETLSKVGSGESRLVIGTHALFEGNVRFANLALVVVDEQHRFGVLQRAALTSKAERPDVLVMTATPIPRSLTLAFSGDLDLSVIDELPPGRTPVRTVVRDERQRVSVWSGLRKEIERGRQAYIVVPLVEETEGSDLQAATELAERLKRQTFPDFSIGLIHGRLEAKDKESVMSRFVAGEIQILVATTVIEVGVDVANATVMIIEHAERFGLSQLHQLRGRVGRGAKRSYCVLITGGPALGDSARERLRIMTETNDGFRIADRDLELRGPGSLFGTQQHGPGDLQFLALVLRDPLLIASARDEARALIGAAGGLGRARSILERLGARWTRKLELARVG